MGVIFADIVPCVIPNFVKDELKREKKQG